MRDVPRDSHGSTVDGYGRRIERAIAWPRKTVEKVPDPCRVCGQPLADCQCFNTVTTG